MYECVQVWYVCNVCKLFNVMYGMYVIGMMFATYAVQVLRVCTYVCMCFSLSVCMYVHIRGCLHACATCMHACGHACMSICVYVCRYAWMCAPTCIIYICTYMHIHTFRRICIHTYTGVCVCACISVVYVHMLICTRAWVSGNRASSKPVDMYV